MQTQAHSYKQNKTKIYFYFCKSTTTKTHSSTTLQHIAFNMQIFKFPLLLALITAIITTLTHAKTKNYIRSNPGTTTFFLVFDQDVALTSSDISVVVTPAQTVGTPTVF